MWLHFLSWQLGSGGTFGDVEETDDYRQLLGGSKNAREQRAKWLRDAREEHRRALQLLMDAGASLKVADSVCPSHSLRPDPLELM